MVVRISIGSPGLKARFPALRALDRFPQLSCRARLAATDLTTNASNTF
jgi:hypothetical protein